MKRLSEFDVFSLPVDRIYRDAQFNCRGQFSPDSVHELSTSISATGLQFPVVVQPIADVEELSHLDFDWRLIVGFRRFSAVTTFLDWSEIPATVRYELSDYDAHLVNFSENLERKDLNVLEEALTLGRLFPPDMPSANIAKALQRSKRWVQSRRRLVQLPEEVQEKVAAGTLSLLDVDILSELPSAEEQIRGAKAIAHAKRSGRKPSAGKLTRRFHYRKSKAQISQMIEQLMIAGISGLPTRLLAWTAGYISDDEIKSDIRKNRPDKSPYSV